MRGPRRLRSGQFKTRSIPEIADRALAIGTANALRLNVKVGSHEAYPAVPCCPRCGMRA